jgi:hypothetical protein
MVFFIQKWATISIFFFCQCLKVSFFSYFCDVVFRFVLGILFLVSVQFIKRVSRVLSLHRLLPSERNVRLFLTFHVEEDEDEENKLTFLLFAVVTQPSELSRLSDENPIWDTAAWYLAQLCTTLILTVSPHRIVLGGGVMKRHVLFPLIRNYTLKLLNGYIAHSTILRKCECLSV